MVPVDSKLYKKFKDKPNFQAFADNQMGELIKAQQRGYNKKFFKPENTNLKPSNLYQEYLKKTGILRDPSISNTNNSCLLYTSPSPRDKRQSRMPSSA